MVLGPQRPLFTGKETLPAANTCLRPRGLSRQGLPGTTTLSWLSSPGTQRPPSRSPSRPLGNKRQTLSQNPGLCEQGIINGHNPFLVCHLLECNRIFFWYSFENYGLSVDLSPLVHIISHFNPNCIPLKSHFPHPLYSLPSSYFPVSPAGVCLWVGGVGEDQSPGLKLQAPRLMWSNQCFKTIRVSCLPQAETHIPITSLSL